MTHSNSKRLTPRIATAVVLYIAAAVMAVTVLGLTIAAGNNGVIMSAEVHFVLTFLSLLITGVLSTLASAAADGLYSFPKDGAVDPAPYQLLPSIAWKDSNTAMMLNFYISAGVFAVITAGLLIAGLKDNPAVLFSPVIHFLLCTTSLVATAAFLIGGAIVQVRSDNGDSAEVVVLWITAIVLAIISAVFAICAGNGALLFGPGFHFVMVFGTLAAATYTFYRAGRTCDGDSKKQTATSIHLFIIAGILAVVALIVVIAAINVIIFSALFHIALVVVLLVLAGVIAITAALLTDRTN